MGKSQGPSKRRTEEGGPSSRPTQGQRRESTGDPSARESRRFSASRFTSRANEDWYKQRAKMDLIVEKTIYPDIEAPLQVREYFVRLGWESIFGISGEYYPTLVREFYANIQDKTVTNLSDIRTFVRGMPIQITDRTVANALHMSPEGVTWVEKNTLIQHDPNFNMTATLSALGLNYENSARGYIISNRWLSMRDRIFIYLLGTNVFPHSSSFNEMRTSDIYFLYRAKFGPWDPKVSLVRIIIQNMRQVVHGGPISFRYPVLITGLLTQAGVNFGGEAPVRTDMSNMVTMATLTRLNGILVNGVWRNKLVEPLQPQEVAVNETVDRRGRRRQREPEPANEEAEFAAMDEGGAPDAPDPAQPQAQPRPSFFSMLQDILSTCRRVEDRQLADSIEIHRILNNHERRLDDLARRVSDQGRRDDVDEAPQGHDGGAPLV